MGKLYYSWPCFPHHSETLWKIIFLSIFNLVRFQPLGSNTEILTFILIVICTQVYKWLHEIFNRPWQRPQAKLCWSSNKVDSYHKWSLNLLWNIGQQSIVAVCPIETSFPAAICSSLWCRHKHTQLPLRMLWFQSGSVCPSEEIALSLECCSTKRGTLLHVCTQAYCTEICISKPQFMSVLHVFNLEHCLSIT